jgi:hypothetical protein
LLISSSAAASPPRLSSRLVKLPMTSLRKSAIASAREVGRISIGVSFRAFIGAPVKCPASRIARMGPLRWGPETPRSPHDGHRRAHGAERDAMLDTDLVGASRNPCRPLGRFSEGTSAQGA